MSAKNFTLDEALSRIEALEKRRYFTMDVLFEGDLQSGDCTLSRPYTDYQFLIVQGSSDSRVRDRFNFIVCSDIPLNHEFILYSNSSAYNDYDNAEYWNGHFKSTTTLSGTIDGKSTENCCIKKIYGVNFTNNLYYKLLDSFVVEVAA